MHFVQRVKTVQERLVAWRQSWDAPPYYPRTLAMDMDMDTQEVRLQGTLPTIVRYAINKTESCPFEHPCDEDIEKIGQSQGFALMKVKVICQ